MADYIGISQGFVTSNLAIQIFICKNCRKRDITDKAVLKQDLDSHLRSLVKETDITGKYNG